MDEEVTGSADWTDAEGALFFDMPILSLVIDPEDLFGEDGLYENPLEWGDATERATSIEWLTADGSVDFTVDCGARIHGGAGRRPDRSPKKSFRLLFKSEYGPALLDAPIYEDSEVTTFNTLVIRAGYNRAWVNWQDSQRVRSQYVREAFASDVHREMGDLAPHVQPVHLFLNGMYWGLYQVEERPDASFHASYTGGEEEDWDALNSGEAVDGDLVAWEAFMALVDADLSDPDAYAAVTDALDLDRFIDYMLLQLVLGNYDWPAKNWWSGRRRDDGERWFFVAWDSELTMISETSNYLDVDDEDTPGEIFQALRESEEFLVRFGDRAQKHLFEGGALSPEALAETWDRHADRVVPGVVGESARWGDHWRDSRGEDTELYTYTDHWVPEYERVTETWIPLRRQYVIEDFQAVGLYPTVAAPTLSPFGGAVSAIDAVSLTADEGDVYYTLDGTDPREEGGAIAEVALLYTGDLTLSEDATLRARVWTEDGWSALVEADFTVE